MTNNRGFTLIETMIYAILISSTIGGSLLVVYQILEGSEELNTITVREEEASFILRKIQWALTGVDEINLPNPGGNGSTLSIDKTNFAQNPIVFDLDSGDIRMSRGGGGPNILNTSRVVVNNLDFSHIAQNGDRPAGIRTLINIGGADYETLLYLR